MQGLDIDAVKTKFLDVAEQQLAGSMTLREAQASFNVLDSFCDFLKANKVILSVLPQQPPMKMRQQQPVLVEDEELEDLPEDEVEEEIEPLTEELKLRAEYEAKLAKIRHQPPMPEAAAVATEMTKQVDEADKLATDDTDGAKELRRKKFIDKLKSYSRK
jgi:hypothetical protein